MAQFKKKNIKSLSLIPHKGHELRKGEQKKLVKEVNLFKDVAKN